MTTLINFYDELGIDRESTLAEIHEQLRELKHQHQYRAGRGGSLQEAAKKQLEFIDDAETVFSDDDAREAYDLELRRAAQGLVQVSEPEVDWTSRAFNYYYIGDNGAALVASRKAKEQSPKSPMPHVVASWVQLKDGEYRQAKLEADEAFVLDELTEDSVDVQKVRGTAYFFVDDHNRAITSFDKALAKAVPGEKPDIYWRKGLVNASGLKRPQEAYNLGIEGLSTGVELLPSERNNLAVLVSNQINTLDIAEDGSWEEDVRRLKRRKTEIENAPIDGDAKALILGNLNQNLKEAEKRAKLEADIKRLEAIKKPEGSRPALGCVSYVVPLVMLGIAIPLLGVGGGATAFGVILLLATLGVGYWLFTKFQKGKQWDEDIRHFENSQKELETKLAELKKLNAADSMPILLEL